MISEQPMHRRPAVDPPCISRLPKWLTYVRKMSCSTWYHWLLANVSQWLGQLWPLRHARVPWRTGLVTAPSAELADERGRVGRLADLVAQAAVEYVRIPTYSIFC